MRGLAKFGGLCLVALAMPAGAQAQSVADFYKGKNVTIIVGYTAGGGYDLYARALGRHMGRHLPGNPNFVVQNLTGAGSLNAANNLYNVAAERRHRVRHLRPRARDGAADRHRPRAIRRHQIHLARQRQPTRSRCARPGTRRRSRPGRTR